jgi:hypothetical protein
MGSRSRETQNTLSGEGCGHINDHVGESWRLVIFCTSVTHKDPWIHTSMCWRFSREIKESIRLRGKIKNDPRPGGCVEPSKVGALRQSGIRAYHICFCRREEMGG